MLGFAPQAAELWRYDKHHLVPFGEFIPPLFKWFTQMMNIPLGDFNRGALGQPSFAWAGQRLAAHICYEDLFGEELATRFVDVAVAAAILRGLICSNPLNVLLLTDCYKYATHSGRPRLPRQ